MPEADSTGPTELEGHVVTGPTSGIGRATALELANHGTVVLVGRAPKKLDEVRRALEKMGGRVRLVGHFERETRCRRDRRAAASGRRPAQQCRHAADASHEDRSGLGHDIRNQPPRTVRVDPSPHQRANIVFVASGVEDPERKPAMAAGFRAGRYISAEAVRAANGGGSTMAGADAYAPSKQCIHRCSDGACPRKSTATHQRG
jgi:hypothetical protein